jgi:hypothetical protein
MSASVRGVKDLQVSLFVKSEVSGLGESSALVLDLWKLFVELQRWLLLLFSNM